MLLGLLCAAAPVAEGPKLAPGSMALRLLDTDARGRNVSSDQRTPLQKAIAASLAAIHAPTAASNVAALAAAEAPVAAAHPAAVSIQQQQASTHGENVSSDQRTPLQKAIAASLAAIKSAPATASDHAVPAAAAADSAAAAMSSPPSSAIPPSPAPRLLLPASATVAPLNARTAEAISPVGVGETGSTVEHIMLGLLFLGMVFFIVDCCGPELSRMFGCRRSRRWSATKGGGGGGG